MPVDHRQRNRRRQNLRWHNCRDDHQPKPDRRPRRTDAVTLTGGTATFNSKDANSRRNRRRDWLGALRAQAGDYTLANPAETASAVITPLSITLTITASNKVYDGNTAATLASEAARWRARSDDVSPSGGTATFSTKGAANSKTVTLTGVTLTGAAAADYTLASPTTTTANITPLGITGSITAANKVYDGTTLATIATWWLTGVIGADTVTLTGGAATFDTKDTGTGKTVTDTGLTLGGAQAANYSLSNPTETATANVTARSISGTITAAGKTYDGTTSATLTSETLTGVLSGDTTSLTGGTAVFNSKDVATATTVTATGLTLTGAQAGDYMLTNPTLTTTANITPLSISGSIIAANKTYDATTHATITTQSLTGVLGSDHVTLTGGTAVFDTKDVGNGKTVTDSGLTLGGAQAADYTLSNPTETATANVTPFSISASVAIAPKTYDGTTS